MFCGYVSDEASRWIQEQGDSSYTWTINFPNGGARNCVVFHFEAGTAAHTANFCVLSVKVLDSAGQVDELRVTGSATILGGHQEACPTELEAAIPHLITWNVPTEITLVGRHLAGTTSAELVGTSGSLSATRVEVVDDQTVSVTATIPDSFGGKHDVVLSESGATKAFLPGGLTPTPEGSTLSMEAAAAFQDCSQLVYSAPADAAGCRHMLCSTAICPSVFRNGACTDQEFVSSYSCVMVFTVAWQPLSNCPLRIEFYVQHWTGGLCHDDATRPVAYWPDGHGGFDPLASLDRTTDANGVVTFSFIAPEVASGLNLVPYSLDSARPFNTQRDTTQRICIRMPDLVSLAPSSGPAFYVLGGAAHRSSGHPAYQWALPQVKDGINVMGQFVSFM